jgi:hypothetical protein
MVFYGAVERSMQSSDAASNQVRSEHNAEGILHTETHLIALEQKIKELREYVDERDNQMRSRVFTKEEHALFDRGREEQMRDIEARLLWLEHRAGTDGKKQ